jgi:hypothetical protein
MDHEVRGTDLFRFESGLLRCQNLGAGHRNSLNRTSLRLINVFAAIIVFKVGFIFLYEIRWVLKDCDKERASDFKNCETIKTLIYSRITDYFFLPC